MRLEIRPLTLSSANYFVTKFHRHHKAVVGHRFSIGAFKGPNNINDIVGVAIVGRPVARETEIYNVAEVLRLCTDGTKNSCSFLYSACARIAKEMGFKKIQTFILATEPGTSVIAAGWKLAGETVGGDWNSGHLNRRIDQPMGPKKRYEKIFK